MEKWHPKNVIGVILIRSGVNYSLHWMLFMSMSFFRWIFLPYFPSCVVCWKMHWSWSTYCWWWIQQVMLCFLLFTANGPCQVLSLWNIIHILEMTSNVSIWDEAHEKIKRKCEGFHYDRQLPSLFFYWPKDNRLFYHCRTNNYDGFHSSNLTFKYNPYEDELEYAIYYDLRYFDECMPF